MEDVLLSLVNSVMRNAGLPTVVKLEIRNPYVLRRWRGDKEPIVDVRATDEKGNVFDLEMQVDGHADFMKRVDYYGARLLVDQIGRGDDYGDLRRVVSIFFVLFPIRKGNEKLWFDAQRKLSIFDHFDPDGLITTIFVRLPISVEQKPQGFNDPELQDWVKLFGYPALTTAEQIEELTKKNRIFQKVGETMGYFFAKGLGRRAYDERERTRRDWVAIVKGAKEEGVEEGIKEGIKTGKTEYFIHVVSTRFPADFARRSDEILARLDLKSSSELTSLIDVGIRCTTFQDVVNSL